MGPTGSPKAKGKYAVRQKKRETYLDDLVVLDCDDDSKDANDDE